jgi:ABC-type hemin transport system ATPase subunit
VSVQQKHTATKLIYQLVDNAGENITGTLNQGALNSLSLATFFAGAQFRVKQGLPEFLILDDPVQSLDQAHQEGLARAAKEFSKLAPVIVACLPSHFTRELERLRSPDDKLYKVHGSDPIQFEEV